MIKKVVCQEKREKGKGQENQNSLKKAKANKKRPVRQEKTLPARAHFPL
jgi:hypothetical protein